MAKIKDRKYFVFEYLIHGTLRLKILNNEQNINERQK